VSKIPRWCKEIVEIVCTFEKKICVFFMDIQLHILILLVDDIEIASVISAKSIFFVERFLKVLKIFARQKS